jgi:hypothetical protein
VQSGGNFSFVSAIPTERAQDATPRNDGNEAPKYIERDASQTSEKGLVAMQGMNGRALT